MSERPISFSLTQLEYFVAVAETGNISAAAARLHASQSALSSALLRLERHLGTQLLIRHHARGVTLTPHGEELLAQARDLLTQARCLEQTAVDLQGGVRGFLSAGCFRTMAPTVIPQVLRTLRREYPELELDVAELDTPEIEQRLRDGSIELAICYRMGLGEETDYREVTTWPQYALVSPTSLLADRGTVSLAELNTVPLVVQKLAQVRERTLATLASAGQVPSRVIEAASYETMRGLVSAGEGFALLYQRVAMPHTYDGGEVVTLELSDPLTPTSVGIATARGARMTERARVFAAAAERVLRASAHAGPAQPPGGSS